MAVLLGMALQGKDFHMLLGVSVADHDNFNFFNRGIMTRVIVQCLSVLEADFTSCLAPLFY